VNTPLAATKRISGVVLGLLLQPLSLFGFIAVMNVAMHGESRGWGLMAGFFGYPLYFGMAQVLTILPAALIMLLLGQIGTVRGLLYVGTVLALVNIAVLVLATPFLPIRSWN